jgi:hypothetical protein
MAVESFTIHPVAGVNYENSSDVIKDTEVSDVRNFLFEGGQVVGIPGLEQLLTFSSPVVFGKSFSLAASPTTIVASSDNKLWYDNAGALNQLVGAGLSWGSVVDYNADVINGEIVLGNNNGGLVRVIPPAPYALVAAAPYKYIVGHRSRAIAAYDMVLGLPRRIAYSKVGDVTNWTPPYGGTVDITEAPDDITGLFNINNVIVVVRRSGIHLGLETGITPPYKWNCWSKGRSGFPYPSTLTSDGSVIYGCGPDNVYTFDLAELKPIGTKIRKVLIPLLKAGIVYQGCISQLTAPSIPRTRYHLIPKTAGYPHFCYDIADGTWTVLSHLLPVIGGFDYISQVSGAKDSLCLFTSGVCYIWTWNVLPGSASWLVSKTHAVEPLSKNFAYNRTLLAYRDTGATRVKMSVSFAQEEELVVVSKERSVGGEGDQELRRAWFNHEGVNGQQFQLRVDVPADNRLSFNTLVMQISPGGDFRGVE